MGTKKPKEKYKFVFPNFMAKALGKVDMRTQMEAGMVSQGLLLLGLSLMVILMVWTSPGSTFYTILITFNLLCGWLMISSYLVTTYQQYTNYMEAAGYDPQAEKEKVKKQGNIFKRMARARRNKKIKKELRVPTLIGDAVLSKELVDKNTNETLEKIDDAIKVQGRDNYGK